jgi:hypothetical protein
MLEEPKLFQALQGLKGRWWSTQKGFKSTSSVGVNAEVPRGSAFIAARLIVERPSKVLSVDTQRSSAEVDGSVLLVTDDLNAVRIHQLASPQRGTKRAHRGSFIFPQPFDAALQVLGVCFRFITLKVNDDISRPILQSSTDSIASAG